MKINDIVKSKKNYSFYTPEEYGNDFYRIPSGVFALDICIGGGVPVNVTTSFYGPPGGFKSGVTTKLLASAQNICWNCFEYLWDCSCGQKTEKKSVIIQTEVFDLDWAETLGVDTSKLVIAEPRSGEEAVDIIYECLKADDCGLIVLDSLSRVIPESEIVDPALSHHVGGRAKLHAKLMNKVKSSLIQNKRDGKNTAFVATNQIRAAIGNHFGPTEEITGGFASKHDWHLTCRMSQLKTKPEFVNKETELPSYGRFRASIISPGIKRKIFTMNGTAEFYVAMEDTIEHSAGTVFDHKTTFNYADSAGLIDRSKWEFLGVEYGTKAKLMETWAKDPKIYLSAKKKVVDHYISLKKADKNAV